MSTLINEESKDYLDSVLEYRGMSPKTKAKHKRENSCKNFGLELSEIPDLIQ